MNVLPMGPLICSRTKMVIPFTDIPSLIFISKKHFKCCHQNLNSFLSPDHFLGLMVAVALPGCCMVLVFAVVGVVITMSVEPLCGCRGFVVGEWCVIGVTCSC